MSMHQQQAHGRPLLTRCVGLRSYRARVTEHFVRDVHNLLAEIRGVATSLTIGGPGAFARNLELGVGAFSRGPDLAVGMAALISVRRFEQLNDARIAGAREVMVFPKEELLRSFRIRKGAVPD